MNEPAPNALVHCCACADKEDTREISATVLSIAQIIATDLPPGECKDAAVDLLTSAFKAEKRKHDAVGLPRLG
jgi:hypothetical protein